MSANWWSLPWVAWPVGWIVGVLSDMTANYLRDRRRRGGKRAEVSLDMSWRAGEMHFEGEHATAIPILKVLGELYQPQGNEPTDDRPSDTTASGE